MGYVIICVLCYMAGVITRDFVFGCGALPRDNYVVVLAENKGQAIEEAKLRWPDATSVSVKPHNYDPNCGLWDITCRYDFDYNGRPIRG